MIIRKCASFGGAILLFSLFCFLTGRYTQCFSGETKKKAQKAREEKKSPRERTPVGLLRKEKGAFEGYTLFAPLRSGITYLIDMDGNVVHTWRSEYPPGNAVYLQENGGLLRCARDPDNSTFFGGGAGGRIEEFDWEGSLTWEYYYSSSKHLQHHDIEPLPNGNILLIAWERKSRDEALEAGRDPSLLDFDALWPDHIVEVKPTRPRGGQTVWEWHAWDHLIQDRDPEKNNYGSVADHPERIDINGDSSFQSLSDRERKRLKALGYITESPLRRKSKARRDWTHINSVAYNQELDQILMSVHTFNEIWIIDHSTTREEAKGRTGGRHGRGGDLLYRWGNPLSYKRGTREDQKFFAQHDAQWIPKGCPGEGNILVFNNGLNREGSGNRPDQSYSSVDEIVPPIDEKGRYGCEAGSAFGPACPVWTYCAPEKSSFFSGHISGAQRLCTGSTLICSGESGKLFEVSEKGKILWEFVNPFEGGNPGEPDGGPRGFPPWKREGRDRKEVRGERKNGPGREPMPGDRDGGMPPGGPFPGRPPMGGRMRTERNSLFRATRLPADYPGVAGLKAEEAPAERASSERER